MVPLLAAGFADAGCAADCESAAGLGAVVGREGVTASCADLKSGCDDAPFGRSGDEFDALGGSGALEVTRSSLLGGWTALVVTIAPPANPTATATKAVATPAK